MKSYAIFYLLIFVVVQGCAPRPANIELVYPNGAKKALIMSYDDGLVQDVQLISLFNQHNIKGTFNLNSGLLGQTNTWKRYNAPDMVATYVSKDSLVSIYAHHEIAAHGYTHLNFAAASDSAIYNEIVTDMRQLNKLTNRSIVSMAYPFGSSNERIAQLAGTTGITNARTVASTLSFALPNNFLLWHPTCHDSVANDLAMEFLTMSNTKLAVFHVWGHSWEFDDLKRWDSMVSFCNTIGNRNDIWYAGAGEFTAYVTALNNLVVSDGFVYNSSLHQSVWYKRGGRIRELLIGKRIRAKTIANL